MAQTRGNLLVHWLVTALLLIALLGGANAIEICGLDTTKLDICHAAVTGRHPPKPNARCCALVRRANFACLCRYKSILPSFGINPTNAFALPRKCGLRKPPKC